MPVTLLWVSLGFAVGLALLLMLTHRVLVMRDHRIVAWFETAHASEDQILLAATGADRPSSF